MSTKLLHTLARLVNDPIPDAALLARFTQNRDEQAFDELVRRHGPLVWSVCRHLLPQHADAEDAFQAVFLALVQNADPSRVGQALPAWLHGVSVRVAAKVKRSAVRRQRRELRASVPEADRSVPDAAWAALMTAVHEEVERLPDAERTAFVMCELEGVRQPDAAARLGWPLGTLSGRLCKARQRLLERLTRRGIAPAAAVAMGGLVGSAGTVPAALVNRVSSFSATKAGVSSTVAELARGLVEGATMRTKVLAATLLVAGAIGIGGGAMVLSQADAQPPGAQSPSGGGSKSESKLPIQGGSVDSGIAPAGRAHPAWEYKFVDANFTDLNDFKKTITQLGGEGWEYISSEKFQGGTMNPLQAMQMTPLQTVLVFKRSRNSFTAAAETRLPATKNNAPAAGLKDQTSSATGNGTSGRTTSTTVAGAAPKSAFELEIFQLKYASLEEITVVLGELYEGRENEFASVATVPRTNQLIIRASKETILELEKLLQKLDVPIEKK